MSSSSSSSSSSRGELKQQMFFTDGAAKGNQFAKLTYCGWGVWNSTIKEGYSGVLDSNSSNIQAEGTAILHALTHANNGDIIYTDSEFWINMITTFMPKWYEEGLDEWKEKNNFVSKTNPNGKNIEDFTLSNFVEHDIYARFNKQKNPILTKTIYKLTRKDDIIDKIRKHIIGVKYKPRIDKSKVQLLFVPAWHGSIKRPNPKPTSKDKLFLWEGNKKAEELAESHMQKQSVVYKKKSK